MDTSGTPARAGAEATTAGIAQQRSRWWYLVPLLLAIVGGVVAYFAVRRDDPRLARNCLVLSVVLMAAGVAVQAIIWAADPEPLALLLLAMLLMLAAVHYYRR